MTNRYIVLLPLLPRSSIPEHIDQKTSRRTRSIALTGELKKSRPNPTSPYLFAGVRIGSRYRGKSLVNDWTFPRYASPWKARNKFAYIRWLPARFCSPFVARLDLANANNAHADRNRTRQSASPEPACGPRRSTIRSPPVSNLRVGKEAHGLDLGRSRRRGPSPPLLSRPLSKDRLGPRLAGWRAT